jgi:hypothetical protein
MDCDAKLEHLSSWLGGSYHNVVIKIRNCARNWDFRDGSESP